MAQVEVIMYVALGFGVAALIALLLGRLVWNLAVAVGRRRAQRSSATPAVAELMAERNQLRAEHAMLARRVEVRLDDLKRQVAEQMAEVARSRNRMDRLGAEIEKRDAMLGERDGEIARLKEQVASLVAELSARNEAVDDLHGSQAKRDEAIADLRRQLAERDQLIERLRGDVDRHAAARSEAASRERSAQERLKGRIEDLANLSHRIEAQRRQLLMEQSEVLQHQKTTAEEVGEAAPDVPVERRASEFERKSKELHARFDQLDEIWAAKLADVARAVASEPPSVAREDQTPVPEPLPDSQSPSVVSDHSGAAAAAAAAPLSETQPAKPQDGAAPAEDDKKTGSGLANVISLAQRIRGLQRNGS